MLFSSRNLLATVPLVLLSTSLQAGGGVLAAVNSTTCNGKKYVYNELAGYGFVPHNARDKLGDTIGGIGSSIAVTSWVRLPNHSYTGLLYALPDRGWNTEGTLNYQNRIQKFSITFTPNTSATVANPSPPNLQFTYLDTILLTDPAGNPTSGLDGALTGPYLTFPDYPFPFPSANYTGDGFGGSSSGGGNRVVIDSEGLVLNTDGTFWISDEYGDYIYHFSPSGRMMNAIRPPFAYIPQRNGQDSFSADSPPRYHSALRPTPRDPVAGRANNQGLEGLTRNSLGTKLYALTQSALRQDIGGDDDSSHHPNSNSTNNNSRFLVYDISSPHPRLEAEYIVPLPPYTRPGDDNDNDSSTTSFARQSEIHYISPTQFLILARDSGAGRGRGEGEKSTTSLYRHVDVFDISEATDISSSFSSSSLAASSNNKKNFSAAQYCSWLDYNVNSQLLRFGLRNGGAAQSEGLLNEKWESLAVLDYHDDDSHKDDDDDDNQGKFYILSFSDNDFITQDGKLNHGRFVYRDGSGYSLENQALLFSVQLPVL